MFISPLFCVIALLCVARLAYCGENVGKEIQPKLPPLPKKEEKHENKKEVKQTFSICYQGYTLRNDKKCVMEISEAPIEISNVVTVPYLQRCPPNFSDEKKKNVCSTSVEVPPEYYCPAGWTDNVVDCIVTEPPEYIFECPKGKKWEMIDDRCVITHTAKQIISSQCPEGSNVEEDGHCWKTIGHYDCTPEKKDKKGSKKEEKKKVILRRLGEKEENKKHETKKHEEKKNEEKKPKVELLKEMEQVTPPRTTKVGVASQLCERKVLVDPLVSISCPEGFVELKNEECWREEVTTPIRVCASKEGKDESDCPSKHRATPKMAKCPPGTEKEKEKCFQVTIVPPLNVCPPDWTDSGEGCIGTLADVPRTECRPGLKLFNGQCVGELVRPPINLTLKVPPESCETKKY